MKQGLAPSLTLGFAAVAVAVLGLLLLVNLGDRALQGTRAPLVAFLWLFGGPSIAALDIGVFVPADRRAGLHGQARCGLFLSAVACLIPLLPLFLPD